MVVFFRRAGDIDLRRGPSKEHETETVDQHKINASSLFVAFARSCGTAYITFVRGHVPQPIFSFSVLEFGRQKHVSTLSALWSIGRDNRR